MQQVHHHSFISIQP